MRYVDLRAHYALVITVHRLAISEIEGRFDIRLDCGRLNDKATKLFINVDPVR